MMGRVAIMFVAIAYQAVRVPFGRDGSAVLSQTRGGEVRGLRAIRKEASPEETHSIPINGERWSLKTGERTLIVNRARASSGRVHAAHRIKRAKKKKQT